MVKYSKKLGSIEVTYEADNVDDLIELYDKKNKKDMEFDKSRLANYQLEMHPNCRCYPNEIKSISINKNTIVLRDDMTLEDVKEQFSKLNQLAKANLVKILES